MGVLRCEGALEIDFCKLNLGARDDLDPGEGVAIVIASSGPSLTLGFKIASSLKEGETFARFSGGSKGGAAFLKGSRNLSLRVGLPAALPRRTWSKPPGTGFVDFSAGLLCEVAEEPFLGSKYTAGTSRCGIG